MTRYFLVVLLVGFAAVSGNFYARTDASTHSGTDSQQDSTEREPTWQPLKDWWTRTGDQVAKGQIDLGKSTEITIDAKLNSDCKLSDLEVVQKTGDPRLVDVSRDLLAALGESRLFIYLGDRENKNIEKAACVSMPLHSVLRIDQSEVTATLEYPMDTQSRAAALARGFNAAIRFGATAHRNKPTGVILNGIRVSSQAERIIANFTIARLDADQMLQKQR